MFGALEAEKIEASQHWLLLDAQDAVGPKCHSFFISTSSLHPVSKLSHSEGQHWIHPSNVGNHLLNRPISSGDDILQRIWSESDMPLYNKKQGKTCFPAFLVCFLVCNMGVWIMGGGG